MRVPSICLIGTEMKSAYHFGSGTTACWSRHFQLGVWQISYPASKRSSPLKIFIHLGFQKTGTTFAQSVFSRNREIIEPHCAFRIRGGKTRKLRKACNAFLKTPTSGRRKDLTAVFADIRSEFEQSGRSVAFLSDENIIGHDYYKEGQPSLTEAIGIMLPLMEEAFSGHDLCFLFFTREMDAWLRSSYNQSVFARRYTISYEDWVHGIPFETDWDEIRRITEAATTTARVVFFSFEDERQKRFMGISLLKEIGLSDEALSRIKVPPRKNESLPSGAIAFLREANATEMSEQDMHVLRRLLRTNRDCFQK